MDACADNAPLVRCGGSVRGARSECGGATFQLALHPQTREQMEHAVLQTQHLALDLNSYELFTFVYLGTIDRPASGELSLSVLAMPFSFRSLRTIVCRPHTMSENIWLKLFMTQHGSEYDDVYARRCGGFLYLQVVLRLRRCWNTLHVSVVLLQGLTADLYWFTFL